MVEYMLAPPIFLTFHRLCLMFMTLHIVPSIQNLPATWILLHIELSFMQDCPLHKMDFHTGLSCKKMFLQTGMSYKQEYPANRSVLYMYTGLFCTQAKIRESIFFLLKNAIFSSSIWIVHVLSFYLGFDELLSNGSNWLFVYLYYRTFV